MLGENYGVERLEARGFELRLQQRGVLSGHANHDMPTGQVAQTAIQINAKLRVVVVATPGGDVLVYVMAKMGSDRPLLARRTVAGSRRIAHLERDDPQQDNNQKTQHAADSLSQRERTATHYSQCDPEGKQASRRPL